MFIMLFKRVDEDDVLDSNDDDDDVGVFVISNKFSNVLLLFMARLLLKLFD